MRWPSTWTPDRRTREATSAIRNALLNFGQDTGPFTQRRAGIALNTGKATMRAATRSIGRRRHRPSPVAPFTGKTVARPAQPIRSDLPRTGAPRLPPSQPPEMPGPQLRPAVAGFFSPEILRG